MSWFPERMGADGPVDLDEGVRLERRGLLKVSVGALALLSLSWPQRALAGDAATDDDADLAWDGLVKAAVPLAERLVGARKPNEEVYLARLAALVHRLRIPGDADSLHAKRPLVVAQFKLEPGKGFTWHDHRDYNGLLLCVAGEARVRTADILGGNPRPPKGRTFEIREIGDTLLTAGRASGLTRTRENVHDVRGAGKDGARLLDFFTFFEAGGRSVSLKVEEQLKDPVRRIHEAVWSE
jgi:hypothetical protein